MAQVFLVRVYFLFGFFFQVSLPFALAKLPFDLYVNVVYIYCAACWCSIDFTREEKNKIQRFVDFGLFNKNNKKHVTCFNSHTIYDKWNSGQCIPNCQCLFIKRRVIRQRK